MITVAIAGCVVSLFCLCVLALAQRQMRLGFQRQLSELSAAVRALEQAMANRATGDTAPAPAEVPEAEIEATKVGDPVRLLPIEGQGTTEIPPETQAAIEATLCAMLGHRVRIRAVKQLEQMEAANQWATQGRMAIQSSHNQRVSHD